MRTNQCYSCGVITANESLANDYYTNYFNSYVFFVQFNLFYAELFLL